MKKLIKLLMLISIAFIITSCDKASNDIPSSMLNDNISFTDATKVFRQDSSIQLVIKEYDGYDYILIRNDNNNITNYDIKAAYFVKYMSAYLYMSIVMFLIGILIGITIKL